MIIKIGSFNLLKFSYQADKEIHKNFDYIAKIIADTGMQIVAIQEVFSKQALVTLVQHLNGAKITSPWKLAWEQPTFRHERINGNDPDARREGYGFIWNTNYFEESTNQKGEKISPRIINGYHIDKKQGQTELVRNPFYGTFTTTNLFRNVTIEVRLINTHIMFGKSKLKEKNDEDMPDLGDIRMRHNEYDVLSETIYPKVDCFETTNKKPVTILLGDYNLNLIESGCKGPYIISKSSIERKYRGNNSNNKIITVQKEKTTLKREKIDENGNDINEHNHWANNYDHFTYDPDKFEDRGIKISKIERIDSIQSLYGEDKKYVTHRKEISDHVPILIEIDYSGSKQRT